MGIGIVYEFLCPRYLAEQCVSTQKAKTFHRSSYQESYTRPGESLSQVTGQVGSHMAYLHFFLLLGFLFYDVRSHAYDKNMLQESMFVDCKSQQAISLKSAAHPASGFPFQHHSTHNSSIFKSNTGTVSTCASYCDR